MGRVYTNASRAVRALRLRKGWTQSTLGRRAGVSRQVVSRIERGDVAGVTIGVLDRVATALAASVTVQCRWRGAELDRLIDAAHAALQQDAAALLIGCGWEVRAEVSFNHFGDRGRVDLLALDPSRRVLLVVEVKSALGDLQETLGRLDVKARLGRQIAAEVGWDQVGRVVPALVLADSKVARRAVVEHPALFARYGVRGRRAVAWLRALSERAPSGLLWFANRPNSRGVGIQHGKATPHRL